MKNILSFGAGVNSTALIIHMVKEKMPIDEVIFSDTGDELPETYTSLGTMQKWAKEHGLIFTVVSSHLKNPTMKGYYEDKNIIPFRAFRDCTSKFKVSPIRNYLRKKYGKQETFKMHIGIALEEIRRMRDSDVKYIKNSYPLIDARIDREECKRIIEKEGLEVPVKSGCYYCPFNNSRSWKSLLEKHPVLFDLAIVFEEQGSKFPQYGLYSIKLRQLKNDLKSQTKLFDNEGEVCSGYCWT